MLVLTYACRATHAVERRHRSSTPHRPSSHRPPPGSVLQLLLSVRSKLDAELAELLLRHLRGRAAHRGDAGLVLREGDDVAQVRLAGQPHPPTAGGRGR